MIEARRRHEVVQGDLVSELLTFNPIQTEHEGESCLVINSSALIEPVCEIQESCSNTISKESH